MGLVVGLCGGLSVRQGGSFLPIAGPSSMEVVRDRLGKSTLRVAPGVISDGLCRLTECKQVLSISEIRVDSDAGPVFFCRRC